MLLLTELYFNLSVDSEHLLPYIRSLLVSHREWNIFAQAVEEEETVTYLIATVVL